MPRYFFDMSENGQHLRDDVGLECSSTAAARHEALKALPAIATEQISKNSDRQQFAVRVRNCEGRAIYSATLTFFGTSVDADIPTLAPVPH